VKIPFFAKRHVKRMIWCALGNETEECGVEASLVSERYGAGWLLMNKIFQC
jgi:hypothetical protein